MIDKGFIKEQCIRGLAVKARKKHIHNNKQIDLWNILLFQTFCNILTVSIKSCKVKTRAKHSVVIVHALLQIPCRMFVLSFRKFFVRLKGEDSTNLVAFVILLLENVVIIHKRLYLINCKQRRIYIFSCRLNMRIKRRKNMFCNHRDTMRIVIQFIKFNVLALAVIRVVNFFRVKTLYRNTVCADGTHILNREAEYIAVCYSLFNHIAMNTRVKCSRKEHICRCPTVASFIFFKDRRSCEADVITVVEMPLDVAVHFSEL